MKVLHVIPAVARRYGGPSVAVLEMCRALRERGVEATIAATDADGSGRLAVETGRVVTFAGQPAVFFRRFGPEALKWSTGMSGWLKKHVASFDAVHVHAVFSYACWAAARAAGRAGVPFIVRPLGTLDPWSLSHHAGRKRLWLQLGLRRVLAKAAFTHYTSRAEQELAERALPWLPPGVVVPLGVEAAFFGARAERDPARPYLLALGRLHPKKNLASLIEAFHRLNIKEQHAGLTLIVAGDGPADYVRVLRAAADAGPNAGHIRFVGWQDGPDRVRLIAGAELLAMPSEQENFGLAAAEAMAAGVPVLVGPGVNLSDEVAAFSAGWVAKADADSLAQALREALANPQTRTARGQAARQLAARYQWPRIAHELAAVYEHARAGATAGAPEVPVSSSVQGRV